MSYHTNYIISYKLPRLRPRARRAHEAHEHINGTCRRATKGMTKNLRLQRLDRKLFYCVVCYLRLLFEAGQKTTMRGQGLFAGVREFHNENRERERGGRERERGEILLANSNPVATVTRTVEIMQPVECYARGPTVSCWLGKPQASK